MNSTAIQQAIQLYKHPKEMQWLTTPNAQLPEGVTDLLRLYASSKKLNQFVEKLHLDQELFCKVLNNFIEKVIINEKNDNEKMLGLNKGDDSRKRKIHYQLLMKIYHPDRNTSSHAVTITSNITKAYQSLKKQEIWDNKEPSSSLHNKNDRTPPNSFYKATYKAEQQLSRTKNAFLTVTALSVFSLFSTIAIYYQPDKPQLVINSTDKRFLTVSTQENSNVKASNNAPSNEITLAKLDDIISNSIPEVELQKLLHRLESAYEEGNVKQIKPILENAPEIRDQSDAEINAKLETLFKITSDRKMLLFNVDWQYVSNKQLRGQGKFLSRYLLMGEKQWLTREGNAILTANINPNNQLKITSLKLENKTIEQ